MGADTEIHLHLTFPLSLCQVSALKAQISTYQKETIDAKMGADAEIVRRVELESKLVTKDDEIAFLKKVYEEVSVSR